MTWTAFHRPLQQRRLRRRSEVLRRVVDEADLRRDGALPWHLGGVEETFDDRLDLVGALQLRWHTRLSARIEHELHERPGDPESAVRRAWLATAHDLPGIRTVLDRQAERPDSDEIASALAKATAKDRDVLALAAGRASSGSAIERAARTSYRPGAPMPERRFVKVPSGSAAFVARVKAVLASS